MKSVSSETKAGIDAAIVLPDPEVVTVLNPNDVLFGRGAPSIFYIGNLRFRDVVSKRKADFMNTGRHHIKEEIAEEIYSSIERSNGRFLRRIKTKAEAEKYGISEGTDGWVIVDKKTSMRKVKQALREEESSRRAQAEDKPKDVASEINEATLQKPVGSNGASKLIEPASLSYAGVANQVDKDNLAQQQEINRLQLLLWQEEQKQQQYVGLLDSYHKKATADLSAFSSQHPQGLLATPQGQGSLPPSTYYSHDIYAAAMMGSTDVSLRGMIQRQQEIEQAQAILSSNQLLMNSIGTYHNPFGMYTAGHAPEACINAVTPPDALSPLRSTAASVARLVTPNGSPVSSFNPRMQPTLPFLGMNFNEVFQGPSK